MYVCARVCVCLSNYSHVIALAVNDREFSVSLSKVIALELSEQEEEQITKRTVAIIIIIIIIIIIDESLWKMTIEK